MKRERGRPEGHVPVGEKPYMTGIIDRQQLFRKLFEEALIPTVAGVIAVSPVGKGHMGAAMPPVKTCFRKLFRKFSTAKQRLLPARPPFEAI